MKSANSWNRRILLPRLLVLVGAVAPLLLPVTTAAQDQGIDDLRARVERLERENDALREDLGVRRLPDVNATGTSTGEAIKSLVDSRIQEHDAQLEDKITKDLNNTILKPFQGLKGFKFGMTAYLDYSYGEAPQFNNGHSSYNDFSITRGYLTFQQQFLPWLSARATADTYQDSAGSWNERLKYYYAEIKPPDVAFLTEMKSEFGMGHVPWLDFEEHVNPYRCQGTMAIERAGVFNSSDLGISLRGGLGGTLNDPVATVGTTQYDGFWGSWHVGVYNGAGYHGIEENENKAVEGRITFRPFPYSLPSLQVSYFGLYGEGNTQYLAGWPVYDVNLFMLSFQKPWMIVTAQYFTTEGNASGTWVDAQGHALHTEGYSVFGNVKLPFGYEKWSLFGRFDHFNQDVNDQITTNAYYNMVMVGLAYQICKEGLILLDFETTDYGGGANKKGVAPNPTQTNLGRDAKGQVVLQIEF
jgi:hypothetical protein